MDKRGIGSFLLETLPQAASMADPVRPIVHNKDREAKAEVYVEKYVLAHAKQYKDTEFYLLFPPYWRFDYASMRQIDPVSFAVHQSVVRYVVRRAAELGNVSVFGFEDCSFVDDIAVFRDVTHHSIEINDLLSEKMGKGENLLTPDNVEAYLARCEELARNFDIKGLNEKVKAMLAEKK
jgi:hypothetical protein